MCFAPRAAAAAGLFAVLAWAGAAIAQEAEGASEYVRDGWYAGANWSMGIENWQETAGSSVENAQGLAGYVGWRFLENYGLDIQYEWFHEFQLASPAVSANAHIFTFNLRYYVPFDRIQPYALAGMGLMQSSREGSFGDLTDGASGNFAGRLGGGLDLYLTRNWVFEASAAYVVPSGNLNQLEFFSLAAGFQYRFEPVVY